MVGFSPAPHEPAREALEARNEIGLGHLYQGRFKSFAIQTTDYFHRIWWLPPLSSAPRSGRSGGRGGDARRLGPRGQRDHHPAGSARVLVDVGCLLALMRAEMPGEVAAVADMVQPQPEAAELVGRGPRACGFDHDPRGGHEPGKHRIGRPR